MRRRNKLRAAATAEVSFVGFQDIIFAVTGIIMLTAIVYSLVDRINELTSEEAREVAERRRYLGDLLVGIQESLVFNQFAQRWLDGDRAALPQLEGAGGDLSEVREALVAAFESRNEGVPPPAAFEPPALAEENQALLSTVDALDVEARARLRQVLELELRQRALEEKLAGPITEDRILFEAPPAFRRRDLVLVEVLRDGLRIEGIREGQRRQQEVRDGPDLAGAFEAAGYERPYVILVLRPSGVYNVRETLREVARLAGGLSIEPLNEETATGLR